MNYKIAVIPGDGIGSGDRPGSYKRYWMQQEKNMDFSLDYTELLMGGASIDVHGVPLTDETIETAKASDAVLMGSIGGDAKTSPWYKLSPDKASGSRAVKDPQSPESVCQSAPGLSV